MAGWQVRLNCCHYKWGELPLALAAVQPHLTNRPLLNEQQLQLTAPEWSGTAALPEKLHLAVQKCKAIERQHAFKVFPSPASFIQYVL